MQKCIFHIIKSVLVAVVMTVTTSCVHEFPVPDEMVDFYISLDFDTDLPEWHHSYKLPQGPGRAEHSDSTRGVVHYGDMRYIIHAYTTSKGDSPQGILVKEFTFVRGIDDLYDTKFALQLPEGDYSFCVWSDLLEQSDDIPFYDVSDFSKITFQGEYKGSTDHRDAFRGYASASLVSYPYVTTPVDVHVSMQRPLAKFEFVSTDLRDFIVKEAYRYEVKSQVADDGTAPASIEPYDEDFESRVDFDNYRVVFYYVGFMPHVYNIFNDRPIDSKTGVMFESKLKRINADEASLGFDYVFMNGKESYVTVKIGLYDEAGTQIAMTDAVQVPVKRGNHTVMRGSFMLANSSSGVNIDPSYSGDFNVVIP